MVLAAAQYTVTYTHFKQYVLSFIFTLCMTAVDNPCCRWGPRPPLPIPLLALDHPYKPCPSLALALVSYTQFKHNDHVQSLIIHSLPDGILCRCWPSVVL